MITISKQEYFRLRVAEIKLDLLEGGGVDNWPGYGESLWSDEDYDLDTGKEKVRKEIFGDEQLP
jgi:hypothetical protein